MTPTFGQMMRAFRFRFGWSNKFQCFVRLAPIPNDRCLVEVAPPDKLDKGRSKIGYAIWYEKGGDEFLSLIEPLHTLERPLTEVKMFIVNEQGVAE